MSGHEERLLCRGDSESEGLMPHHQFFLLQEAFPDLPDLTLSLCQALIAREPLPPWTFLCHYWVDVCLLPSTVRGMRAGPESLLGRW